jgi:hypothetical protein
MTGSGTVGDPYIIYDVTDLQAMNNSLAAYYELANDIDASATSGWNSGKGFDPIGSGCGTLGHIHLVPQSDVSQSGTWTVVPVSPNTFYDKVDDGATGLADPTPDDDITYIQATAIGNVQVLHTDSIDIPSYATITNVKCDYMRSKASVYNSTTRCWPGLFVNGTWYKHASTYFRPTASYLTLALNATWTTNPNTSASWTVDDILGTGSSPLQGFGIDVTVIPVAWLRFTTFFFEVNYSASPFVGHFTGNSHTISGLHINRPMRSYVGLFGDVSGAGYVADVTLSNVSIIGYDKVGALIGGIGTLSTGSIKDCSASGAVSATLYAGGLIGYAVGPGGA